MRCAASQLCGALSLYKGTRMQLTSSQKGSYPLLRISAQADVPINQDSPLDFDFRPFFLHCRREHLYRRIDARCEEMVQRGLLQVTLGDDTLHCLSDSDNDSRVAASTLGTERDSMYPSAQFIRWAKSLGSPGSNHTACGRRAQETKEMLLDAGIAPESCSAARAIGYRQALAQLHTWRNDPSTITADSVVCLATLP